MLEKNSDQMVKKNGFCVMSPSKALVLTKVTITDLGKVPLKT
jgi:hypothetical protein